MENHSNHETHAADCLKRTKTGKVEIAGSKSDGQNPSNIALRGLQIAKTDICDDVRLQVRTEHLSCKSKTDGHLLIPNPEGIQPIQYISESA
jgi:hypothetical protein